MLCIEERCRLSLISASLAIGLLAGCSGEGSLGKVTAEATGFATTAANPKQFVMETRPASTDYIPISTAVVTNPLCLETPPAPKIRRDWLGQEYVVETPAESCKDRADFKGIEQRLEARAQENLTAGEGAQALGKALPPPAPAKVQPMN